MEQFTDYLKTTNGKIAVFGGGGFAGLVGICLLCAICSMFLNIMQDDEPVAEIPLVQTSPPTTEPPINTPEPPTSTSVPPTSVPPTSVPPTSIPPTSVPPTSVPPTQSDMSAIPEDVTYSTINEDTIPGIKRSLDIRIDERVSEDALRSIAMELKNSDPNTYERTFIVHYLPGMKIGAGAWATTHFNPDLEIKIQGLTAEEVQELITEIADDPAREIIGRWLNDQPFLGNMTTIYHEADTFYLEEKYGDGSSGIRELTEESSSEGRKFIDNECCDGEFYLIDEQGDLQIWDNDNHIYTAQKISSEMLEEADSAAQETPSEILEPVVLADDDINLRSGPGTNYETVGTLEAGGTLKIVGRNADSSWWQVSTLDGLAWIADSVITANNVNVVLRNKKYRSFP